MRRHGKCICGKAYLGRMFVTDGICWWCGHGTPSDPPTSRGRRRRRLPWDLGALLREGRRPDPHLENVVRLDRLRSRSFLPPIELEDEPRECAACGGHFDPPSPQANKAAYCTPACRAEGVQAYGRAYFSGAGRHEH